MSSLYLTEQGSKVRKLEGRVIVEKDGLEIFEIPYNKIERVIIIGNVQITTQVLSLFFELGIPIAFLTMGGRLKGIVEPLLSKNIKRRIEQYSTLDEPEFILKICKSIVYAKLWNQKEVLKRWVSRREINCDKEIERYDFLLNSVENKNSKNGLMGIEGIGSAIYFEIFGKVINRENFVRKKHPPEDPINAILSYGYAVLLSECITQLRIAGLDPYIGFYHIIRPSRPALALDFMEFLRSPVVDTGVVEMISRDKINIEEDFERDEEEGRIILNSNGKRKFFTYYDNRISHYRKKISDYSNELAISILNRSEFKAYRLE